LDADPIAAPLALNTKAKHQFLAASRRLVDLEFEFEFEFDLRPREIDLEFEFDLRPREIDLEFRGAEGAGWREFDLGLDLRLNFNAGRREAGRAVDCATRRPRSPPVCSDRSSSSNASGGAAWAKCGGPATRPSTRPSQ
jgi:hypothetical protein